jgi:hypothetical protein
LIVAITPNPSLPADIHHSASEVARNRPKATGTARDCGRENLMLYCFQQVE